MKNKKTMVLDIEGMPLKHFATFRVDRLAELPCNATVITKDDILFLEYYKNECKK